MFVLYFCFNVQSSIKKNQLKLCDFNLLGFWLPAHLEPFPQAHLLSCGPHMILQIFLLESVRHWENLVRCLRLVILFDIYFDY